MDFFDEINHLKYLFLVKIKDLPVNSLSITVKAATVSDKEEDLIIGDTNIGPVRSISRDGPGSTYELHFESYAAYNVTNETIAMFNEKDTRVSRLLCIFSKSNYMNYIRELTLADHLYDYEGTLTHYAINCQDHVIDIASKHPPLIKRLS